MMENQEQNTCYICYADYGEERVESTLIPCKHSLCFECLTLSVLKRAICPFCKQTVLQAATQDHIVDIIDLQLAYPSHQSPQTSNYDEANFQLLDHTFFQEDATILLQSLKGCYQRLRQIITQKDNQFDQKWQLYEKVEFEVSKVQKTLNEVVQFDPSAFYRNIQILNTDIEELKQGRWESKLLQKYKEAPRVLADENFLQTTFVISKNKKRNNRKKS